MYLTILQQILFSSSLKWWTSFLLTSEDEPWGETHHNPHSRWAFNSSPLSPSSLSVSCGNPSSTLLKLIIPRRLVLNAMHLRVASSLLRIFFFFFPHLLFSPHHPPALPAIKPRLRPPGFVFLCKEPVPPSAADIIRSTSILMLFSASLLLKQPSVPWQHCVLPF